MIEADETTELVIIGILRKKRVKRTIYHLEQFDGQSLSEAIWMHKSELKNSWYLVRQYEAPRKE